jgi:hypothetical protein
MPLLHFMAVTAIGRTTSIALCFLPAENELTYRQAIQAFKDVVITVAIITRGLDEDPIDSALINLLKSLIWILSRPLRQYLLPVTRRQLQSAKAVNLGQRTRRRYRERSLFKAQCKPCKLVVHSYREMRRFKGYKLLCSSRIVIHRLYRLKTVVSRKVRSVAS